MNKKISIFLLFFSIFWVSTIPVTAANESTVVINGTKLESDVPPVIINGRLMVPLRAIGDALSAVTKWNPVSQEVTLMFNGRYVLVEIGSSTMFYGLGYGNVLMPETVNTIEIDSPPVIISGRTLVPLRAISEGLGAKVTWDESANIANISLSLTEFAVSSVDVTNNFLYFYDGWIYYIASPGNLWRIRPDGTKAMEISKERIQPYLKEKIWIINDWIYLYGNYRHDASTRISRVRTDGTNQQVLSDDDGIVDIVDIVDGWIYYKNLFDREFRKMRLDGTNDTLISNDYPASIAVTPDGWIYYSVYDPDSPLCKIRTDGTDKTVIGKDSPFNFVLGGDSLVNFVMDKDCIYFGVQEERDESAPSLAYGDDLYIYKIEIDDGEKVSRFVYKSNAPIAAKDGWLYYYENSSRTIYKIRTDGSDLTVLEEEWSCRNVIVIGDYIYYSLSTNEEHGVFRIKFGSDERESILTGKW